MVLAGVHGHHAGALLHQGRQGVGTEAAAHIEERPPLRASGLLLLSVLLIIFFSL